MEDRNPLEAKTDDAAAARAAAAVWTAPLLVPLDLVEAENVPRGGHPPDGAGCS